MVLMTTAPSGTGGRGFQPVSALVSALVSSSGRSGGWATPCNGALLPGKFSAGVPSGSIGGAGGGGGAPPFPPRDKNPPAPQPPPAGALENPRPPRPERESERAGLHR